MYLANVHLLLRTPTSDGIWSQKLFIVSIALWVYDAVLQRGVENVNGDQEHCHQESLSVKHKRMAIVCA